MKKPVSKSYPCIPVDQHGNKPFHFGSVTIWARNQEAARRILQRTNATPLIEELNRKFINLKSNQS